jgi:hypothetical protein
MIGMAWVLWVNPKPIDMASFAPANSLLYIEANRPSAVLDALATTDAWKILDQHPNRPQIPSQGGWLQRVIRVTGIGPIDSVIMARAQVAVVVTALGATEEGETLSIRPEVAIILETHTAQRRIQAPLERALQNLVKNAYASPNLQRSTIDGVEFAEWRSQSEDRRIVAAFFGSLVIVGNSQRAVDSCLNVARRRQPSLREDPDLHRTRVTHAADAALAFAYVPASESPRLISIAVALMLGRAPGDTELQKLVGQGAKRIFGSLAWTSRPFKGGIEDRYQISLKQPVVMQLKPHFSSINSASEPPLTTEFYSVSQYRFEDPLRIWEALKTTISLHLDALGAAIFNSILRSGLLAFGIEEPEAFLRAVKSVITTVRLDQQGDRQLLVARVREPRRLIELFERQKGFKRRRSASGDINVFENSEGSTGVALSESLVVVGHPADVQQYFRIVNTPARTDGGDESRRIAYFANSNHASHVSTYTNDHERIQAFLVAILRVSGGDVAGVSQLEPAIAALPYAITETTLRDEGLERITRSPVGQFSTLIPLFVPNPAASPNRHSLD